MPQNLLAGLTSYVAVRLAGSCRPQHATPDHVDAATEYLVVDRLHRTSTRPRTRRPIAVLYETHEKDFPRFNWEQESDQRHFRLPVVICWAGNPSLISPRADVTVTCQDTLLNGNPTGRRGSDWSEQDTPSSPCLGFRLPSRPTPSPEPHTSGAAQPATKSASGQSRAQPPTWPMPASSVSLLTRDLHVSLSTDTCTRQPRVPSKLLMPRNPL